MFYSGNKLQIPQSSGLDASELLLLDRNLDMLETRGPLQTANFDFVIEQPAVFEKMLPRSEFASRVEHEVTTHSMPLVQDLLHLKPKSKIGRFFHSWSVEEPPHGDIHDGYKATLFADKQQPPAEVDPEASAYSHTPIAELTRIPALRRPVTAVVLLMGWVHETTTKLAYESMKADAKINGLVSYADALGKIIKQEATHQFVYKLLYREMQLRHAEQALVEFILRQVFTPVGANTQKQKSHFGMVIRDTGQSVEAIMGSIRSQNIHKYLGAKTLAVMQSKYQECEQLAFVAPNFMTNNQFNAAV